MQPQLLHCFNTASGKHYCNWSLFKTKWQTYGCCVSIPQAVSTIAIEVFGTANFSSVIVSIPQAVSTIAIATAVVMFGGMFVWVSIPQAVSTIAIVSFDVRDAESYSVSIPQAVSTIAIWGKASEAVTGFSGFNTASGKHYCNAQALEIYSKYME